MWSGLCCQYIAELVRAEILMRAEIGNRIGFKLDLIYVDVMCRRDIVLGDAVKYCPRKYRRGFAFSEDKSVCVRFIISRS